MHYPIGIPDNEFLKGKFPMLTQEVRMLMLMKAQIQNGEAVVDIGAGNGSLSIEVALLSPEGMVFALEDKPEGLALIITNTAKFGVYNLRPVPGNVCQGIKAVIAADVVLISDNRVEDLPEVLGKAEKLLRAGGRIVIAVTSKVHSAIVLKMMQAKNDFTIEAFCVQMNPIKQAANGEDYLESTNSVYIITCTKNCKDLYPYGTHRKLSVNHKSCPMMNVW